MLNEGGLGVELLRQNEIFCGPQARTSYTTFKKKVQGKPAVKFEAAQKTTT
jgi:hypothetical protein